MKSKILIILSVFLVLCSVNLKSQTIITEGAWPSCLSLYNENPANFISHYPNNGLGEPITVAVAYDGFSSIPTSANLTIYSCATSTVISSGINSISSTPFVANGFILFKFILPTSLSSTCSFYTLGISIGSLSDHNFLAQYNFHSFTGSSYFTNKPALTGFNGCVGDPIIDISNMTGLSISNIKNGSLTFSWVLKFPNGTVKGTAQNGTSSTGTFNFPAPGQTIAPGLPNNFTTIFNNFGLGASFPYDYTKVSETSRLTLYFEDTNHVPYETYAEFKFALPTLTIPTSNACASSSMTLTASGCTIVTNPRYVFEASNNGISWFNISGTPQISNTFDYTPGNSAGSSIKYRVKVSNLGTGPEFISAPVEVMLFNSSNNGYFGTTSATDVYYTMCQGASSFNLVAGTGSANPWSTLGSNQSMQWQIWDQTSNIWNNITTNGNGLSYSVSTSLLNNQMGKFRYAIIEYFPTQGLTCPKYSNNNAIVSEYSALQIGSTNGLIHTSSISPNLLPINVVNPMNSFTNFEWYKNGVYTGSFGPNYVATSHGKYTLVATHPASCGSTREVSNEIEITGDCNSFIINYSNTTLTSNYNNANLTLEGTITIPNGVSVTLTNTTLNMLKGSKIYIQNGGQLQLDNSFIIGACSGWQGILLEGNLISFNSKINDAEIGIYMDNSWNPILNISNTIFENNHISIYSEGALDLGSFSVNGSYFYNMSLVEMDLSPGLKSFPNNFRCIYLKNTKGSNANFDITGNIMSALYYTIYSKDYKLIHGDDVSNLNIEENEFFCRYENVLLSGECTKNKLIGNSFIATNNTIVADKGITSAIDNQLLIKNNTFVFGSTGILLKGINGFRIKLNNFNGQNSVNSKAIECYNDDYSPTIFWNNKNEIAGNTFDDVEKGAIIAPLYDVFATGSTYNLFTNSGGTRVQKVNILCNTFNDNNYPISGTGVLTDQLGADIDPMNVFNGSLYWDITWYLPNIRSIPFTYYSTNPSTINTYSVPMSNLSLNGYNTSGGITPLKIAQANTYFDCGVLHYNNDDLAESDPIEGIPIQMFKDSKSSIRETINNNSVSLYPNPASSNITINTTLIADKIVVYDAFGKIVLTSSWKKELDIHFLNVGVYLVKLIDGDKIVGSQKFVKIN